MPTFNKKEKMDFSVISLIVLVVVVAIGFIKKVNLGFLSLGVAFILGTCGGMSAKEIAGGFSSSMFVTLVGVTFLFGMASANGTLELFSKKVVALVGKHTVLIPVLMFFLSAFISAIGPGHIAAGILMTTFAMYLAFEMDINPVATALFAKLGANAGCASPLSLTGVLAKSLAEPLGYDGFGLHLFLSTLISGFLFTLILYIAFKSYKVKADNPLKLSEISKFNRDQLCTIAAIIVMVICCIGFQLDTGLFAFVAASVLILLGCADEKKAIKSIPWGTLVFICGVGALINVIKKLGGIDLISNFLTGLMTEKTATPILAATSGILSWVSSTTGVVMPALFPIAADVAAEFAGSVNFVELISTVVATSFAAAISPLSTGGAIIMSSYSAARETSNEEMNKMFKQLFLLSVANVALNVLLSALGMFNLFGLFY
ncbi:MAG: SLC13 family permease [Lachnospiraceae bacterium]